MGTGSRTCGALRGSRAWNDRRDRHHPRRTTRSRRDRHPGPSTFPCRAPPPHPRVHSPTLNPSPLPGPAAWPVLGGNPTKSGAAVNNRTSQPAQEPRHIPHRGRIIARRGSVDWSQAGVEADASEYQKSLFIDAPTSSHTPSRRPHQNRGHFQRRELVERPGTDQRGPGRGHRRPPPQDVRVIEFRSNSQNPWAWNAASTRLGLFRDHADHRGAGRRGTGRFRRLIRRRRAVLLVGRRSGREF